MKHAGPATLAHHVSLPGRLRASSPSKQDAIDDALQSFLAQGAR